MSADDVPEGISMPHDAIETDQELFEVSVKGLGIDVTRKVDQATALGVIATVLGGRGGLASTPPPSPATPIVAHNNLGRAPAAIAQNAVSAPQLDPRMTVGEYIDMCEAQQYPAKITAIGYYLELRKGADSFSKEDIKAQFRPAGEALPANFSRDFNDAISRRWIAVYPEDKDRYFVTNTGKTAIDGKFDKSTRRTTPTAKRRKAASKDSGDKTDAQDKAPEDFANLDEVV